VSAHCSICRHPQRDSINVSLLRDGTRSTARQFQVSRPALDRHKRHVAQTDAAPRTQDTQVSGNGAVPLRSRVEGSIQCCENALRQAQANKDFPGVMRAIRELRGCLGLLSRLESGVSPARDGTQGVISQCRSKQETYWRLQETITRVLQKLRLRQSIALGTIGNYSQRLDERANRNCGESLPGGIEGLVMAKYFIRNSEKAAK